MSRVTVRVQARASRNEVTGFDGRGVLRVRVTAPPAEGRANESVARLLAEWFKIPPGRVRLVLGARSKEKVFEIEGLTGAL